MAIDSDFKELINEKFKGVDIRLNACEKLQDTRFDATEKALLLRTADMEGRLEYLNALRTEVTKDRAQFLLRDSYDTAHESLRTNAIDLGRRLTVVETRSITWTAAIGLIFLVVQFVLAYWLIVR
jgi:HD superfamily phosphohydrolase